MCSVTTVTSHSPGLMMSLRVPRPQAYGGYLATMLLSSEEFTQLKCGAAVSPITDFEIYGTVPRHVSHHAPLSAALFTASVFQRRPSQSATWAQRRTPARTR